MLCIRRQLFGVAVTIALPYLLTGREERTGHRIFPPEIRVTMLEKDHDIDNLFGRDLHQAPYLSYLWCLRNHRDRCQSEILVEYDDQHDRSDRTVLVDWSEVTLEGLLDIHPFVKRLFPNPRI